MIWTLYKKSAKAVCLTAVAVLVGRRTDRIQQQRLLSQINRIISCLQQAHNLHPAWLAQQYGTLDGYMKRHLSDADWQYVLRLRPAEPTSELPVPA